MKIGVDLISGESPMPVLVDGVIDAVGALEPDVEVVIVGPSSVFNPILEEKKEMSKNKDIFNRISILEAAEVITMEDDPLTVVKQKKESSIVKGLHTLKNGGLDAFFSPGNTGAIVVASALVVGRVKGVKKPALAALMPNVDARANILLDVGASAEIEVEDYLKFAIMGQIYSSEMLGIENPRVGLLNIGEEEHKGTGVLKATNKRMSEMDLNFIGNVEGRDLFSTDVDVIVCDGHIGNIALKTAEGAGSTIMALLKRYIKESPLATISVPLYKGALKKLKGSMDPEKYGGAPLLGVNGNVFIGHGSTGRSGITSAIKASVHAVRSDVLGMISRKLAEYHLD